MLLPTVKLTRPGTDQEFIVNESDYRYPDGTIRGLYSKCKVVGHKPLEPAEVKANALEANGTTVEKEAVKEFKANAAANEMLELRSSRQQLAGHLASLPNKGAIIRFVQEQTGKDMDGGNARADLEIEANNALFIDDDEDLDGLS
jgi:hypothetical protein